VVRGEGPDPVNQHQRVEGDADLGLVGEVVTDRPVLRRRREEMALHEAAVDELLRLDERNVRGAREDQHLVPPGTEPLRQVVAGELVASLNTRRKDIRDDEYPHEHLSDIGACSLLAALGNGVTAIYRRDIGQWRYSRREPPSRSD